MDLPHIAETPKPVAGRERLRAFADMWLVDHGFIRDLYLNLHQISPNAWRSAQPGPNHMARIAAKGIKTIVNLRGRRDTCGSYILEREAAAKAGLILVDFPLRSRSAWDKPTLIAATELFETLTYPVLFHCKSGADRAGMMATLYLFQHEGMPLDKAMDQLSLGYGHIKWGPTGIIDYFYESYLSFAAHTPISFRDWVAGVYDTAQMNASFKSSRLGKLIVDKILRRE
jgi:protein tyrosine/serine phosphatase